MEGFRSFTMAMDRASDVCSKWKSADDGTPFSYPEMMLLAAHLDKDFPIEEKQWYIVFPDGEIALLHEDFDEIMPLYKPVKSKPITEKFTGEEFYQHKPDDTKTGKAYCSYCGERLNPGDIYCGNCGRKVE